MKRLFAAFGLSVGLALGGNAWAEEMIWDLPADSQLQAATNQPAIALTRDGAQLKLVFTGMLQSADSPLGPWTDLSTAQSPFILDPSHGQKFFRTRQLAVESVFASRSIVEWTITGPLQKHFELALAGMPDGIFPPVREKPYFQGNLQMGTFDLPVSLRVRGNSSLQECPFPKLKVKISKEVRAGTPFFDAREIKIGTHCAEGGRGSVGRLREEAATFREALAYEIMGRLDFTAPRVRRARIDYRDTTPAHEAETVGWQVTRYALILDDVEVVAARLGGRALSDQEVSDLTNANFDETVITGLRLFHALLGNWDYALSLNGEELWNTDVIELANGQKIPMAGDFDLSSFVTGELLPSFPHDYRPDLEDLDRQAHFEVEKIQGRSSAASFALAQERFIQHRSNIEGLIQAAAMDEAGRTNALRHMTAFYNALAAVTRK